MGALDLLISCERLSLRRRFRLEKLKDGNCAMSLRLSLALCAALICIGSSHQAAADGLGDRMSAAFYDWAARNNITDATFIATDPTGFIAKGSMGRSNPDEPIPVDTLSRSIMKVCEVLAFRDNDDERKTLGEVLPHFFERHTPPWNAQAVTVAEAISSQSPIFPLLGRPLSKNPESRKQLGRQLAYAIGRGAVPPQYRTYPYIGYTEYTALALILQSLKRMPFEAYCANMVFKPLGFQNADLNPTTLNRNAWGAWRISMSAFARMLDYYRKGSPLDLDIQIGMIPYTSRGYYGPILAETCVYRGQQLCRVPFKSGSSAIPPDVNYPCGRVNEFVQWNDEISYVTSFGFPCGGPAITARLDLEKVVYPEPTPRRR